MSEAEERSLLNIIDQQVKMLKQENELVLKRLSALIATNIPYTRTVERVSCTSGK